MKNVLLLMPTFIRFEMFLISGTLTYFISENCYIPCINHVKLGNIFLAKGSIQYLQCTQIRHTAQQPTAKLKTKEALTP